MVKRVFVKMPNECVAVGKSKTKVANKRDGVNWMSCGVTSINNFKVIS